MKRWAAPFLLVISLPMIAAEPAREMRVTGAIVFKNGLAFLTREGTLAFADGSARIAPAPAPLLGTLWIAAGTRAIDEVRATNEIREVMRPAASVADLLDANTGKLATIRVGDREYTGAIMRAPQPDEQATPAALMSSITVSVRPATGLVLINDDGKVRAFERSSVQWVAFAQPPATSVAVPTPQPSLLIRSRGADGAVPATVSYLRSGVSWMPEYSIALLDESRAQVTMQATLINDGEDLRDTEIRFAVGFPNFAFAHVLDPMALQWSLKDFLSRLAGDYSRESRFSNVAMQQVMVNTVSRGDLDGPVSLDARLGGDSAEDLFFYNRAGVTLAAGQRAIYPLLAATVPFRHLYLWEVPAETDETRSVSGQKPADQVWHSISLTNSGSTPWTTAPALVLSHGKPLAQDTLGYTAAGGRGNVKLTVATDVAVEREEIEVERKARDLHRAGNEYDAVTIEGVLTIRSFKREAITVSVDKTVEGTIISHQPEGRVTRRALRPRAINATERIQWDVPVGPGEAKTIKYRYKVWVRV
ncbi:MAG TPA: hypothetical protein VEZ11_16605, partial [Thermoanaerobaculia bacterium]|nr:hypothetical protein [Thermoanaerobaculia bacterium]